MTVALRPIVSPIQPNIKAPIGLNTYVAQYAMTIEKLLVHQLQEKIAR
ncbi:MAG TPA: hypothetical protein LFW11_06630 [Rickettsia endosymbiont of Proechinophthirus fluctus]|nr:hypothetical protein [Rickettsia endosymbiont of Proechinophthirus fluctus]